MYTCNYDEYLLVTFLVHSMKKVFNKGSLNSQIHLGLFSLRLLKKVLEPGRKWAWARNLLEQEICLSKKSAWDKHFTWESTALYLRKCWAQAFFLLTKQLFFKHFIWNVFDVKKKSELQQIIICYKICIRKFYVDYK